MAYFNLVVLLVLVGWCAHRIAKRSFHTSWNPITLYLAVWVPLILLHEARLLQYPPLLFETWAAVGLSFLSFGIGALTGSLAYSLRGRTQWGSLETGKLFEQFITRRARLLGQITLALSVVALYSAFVHWLVLLGRYGGVGGVIANIGTIRREAATGVLSFGVAGYIKLMAYPGAILSGCSLAVLGARRWIHYLPFVAVLVWALPLTARMDILWCFFLYLNAYTLTRIVTRRVVFSVTRPRMAIVAGFALLAILFNVLWQARIGGGEYGEFLRLAAPGFLAAREKLVGQGSFVREAVFGSVISNYAYFTVHLTHFNTYVAELVGHAAEACRLRGAGTFATVLRAFRKLGLLDTETRLTGAVGAQWDVFPSGPSTYLGGIIYDLGILGLVLFPYLLGLFMSVLQLSMTYRPRMTKLSLLAVLYLFIQLSWFGSVFNHTAPVFGLGVGLVISLMVDAGVARSRSMSRRLSCTEREKLVELR